MLLCCLLNLLCFWTLAIFSGSKAPRPLPAHLKNAKIGVCSARYEHLYTSCDRMEGNSWQSGKKLTGHAFVPSRLSAIWIARELSRRGRNSRSVIEESARRDGGRGKMPLLLARARSAGDESSLDYRERAPICCLDSLLGCLSRYFCVFLRIFPSSISLLKGADYSRK